VSQSRQISAIIPTVGRPDLLLSCLESLANQTIPIAEVLVVHCGTDLATKEIAQADRWKQAAMDVRYYFHHERNCARQRNFAIGQATYDNLLLIDDDVLVDPGWAEELFKPIWSDERVGATMGNVTNQQMPSPTPFFRIYRILLHGRNRGLKAGLLVGAALPNGFPTSAQDLIPCEWIGGGVSALRREAFESIGGFAPFFTGSSPGEDLDLGYRLSRKWKVYYVPSATCTHHQSSIGREHPGHQQYLWMRSHFGILRVSMAKRRVHALAHISLWAMVQFLSELASLRRGRLERDIPKAWLGRLRGFLSCFRWRPEDVAHVEATNR
jgi:GT2 family glycosyltransferase